MEVACCDADQEGEWEGEWEECEVVADHGDTCDVRIVEDGELCTSVPRRLVRAAQAEAGAGVEAEAEAEAEVVQLQPRRKRAAAAVEAPAEAPAAAAAPRRKVSVASAAATSPLPGGLRMEVACCDADQEGEWEGEWEECEVVADHGDTCDVRIAQDSQLCRGVPRRFVLTLTLPLPLTLTLTPP